VTWDEVDIKPELPGTGVQVLSTPEIALFSTPSHILELPTGALLAIARERLLDVPIAEMLLTASRLESEMIALETLIAQTPLKST
jgi:hypothetical protein